MSDRTRELRATSHDPASARDVTDDDLASAIAAETARVSGTGQVSVAPRDVTEDGRSATEAPAADARSAAVPQSVGSHRATPSPEAPSATGRPHGRRAAARAPRVRTSATAPIRLTDDPDTGQVRAAGSTEPPATGAGPTGAGPTGAASIDRDDPRTDSGATDEVPAGLQRAPRPEASGPALVWAPDDPFDEAPRPTGRSSYVPPSETGAQAVVPRGSRPAQVAAAPAAPPVTEAAPPEATSGEAPAVEQRWRVDGVDADGLPATVAMPVQGRRRLDVRVDGAGPDAPTDPEADPVARGVGAGTGPIVVPEPPRAAGPSTEVLDLPQDPLAERSAPEPGTGATPPARRRERRTVDLDAATAAAEPETPDVHRTALLQPFVVWAGAMATPVAVVLGFVIGGAGASILAPIALIAGMVPALVAFLRLVTVASRTGAGTLDIARSLLGQRAGVVLAVFLSAVRVLVLTEVLLGVAFLIRAFAPVLLSGPVNPPEVPSIAAVVIAGGLSVASTVWRPRLNRLILLVFAGLSVLITTVLLLLLPPSSTLPAPGGPGDAFAATAGFAGVGLLFVLLAAEVARDRTPGASAIGARVAAAGGIAVAALVLLASIAFGRALGTDADTSAALFVDKLALGVGQRGIAFIEVPISLAVQTLPILLLRSAADGTVDVLGRRSAGRLAAAVLGVVATVVAVMLIEIGADAISLTSLLVPLLGVPVAAWAGLAAASAPAATGLRQRRSTAATAAVAGLAAGTVLGWAAVAVLGGPNPLVGLLVAFALGAAGGVAAAVVERRVGDRAPAGAVIQADRVRG